MWKPLLDMKEKKVTEVQPIWLYQGPDQCEMTHSVPRKEQQTLFILTWVSYEILTD